MKALFLSSHVGLGHVARDYAIANALRRMYPRISIEWCSAEPALSFLDSVGERVYDKCRLLESFSRVIEELYSGGIRGLRDLASRLNILRRNYMLISDLFTGGGYDLVFADELWEVVYTAPRKIKKDIVFATDLVYKPYTVKPIDLLISLVLDRFFKNVIPEFKASLYFNDLDILDDYKWYWFLGGRVRDWVVRYMIPVGFATSYSYDELPGRDYSRRLLGVGDDEALIVVSVGGTSTRSSVFLDCLDKALPGISGEFRKLLGVSGIVVEAITGPRTTWISRSGLIRVVRGVQPRLLTYYAGGDLFITRAGRTTTADIYCLGKPAVFIPIMNHFEQEEIARHIWRKHGYPYIEETTCTPRRLLQAVQTAINTKYEPDDKLCMGNIKTAEILASLLQPR